MASISNEDFERALNSADNQRIMNSVTRKFRYFVDMDELHRCKLIALWESLLSHDATKRKFSTTLYQKLRWMCLNAVNNKNKQKRYHRLEFEPKINPSFNMGELFEPLSPQMRTIMKQRYIDRLTLRELSKIHKICPETVRRRIIRAVDVLKKYQDE